VEAGKGGSRLVGGCRREDSESGVKTSLVAGHFIRGPQMRFHRFMRRK
jgi:hypothetical protein